MADYFKYAARMKQQHEAEASGQVADSLNVRMALIARMDAGEITLAEVQAELKKIRRAAKKKGQITRAQAYTGRIKAD